MEKRNLYEKNVPQITAEKGADYRRIKTSSIYPRKSAILICENLREIFIYPG